MSTTQQPLELPPGYHPPPPSGGPPGRRWAKIVSRAGGPTLIVGILLVIKPEILTGTLETTEAMLRVGALLLGWLVFSFLVRRFVRPPALRTGLIVVVGLALLAVTVRPYFIDTRANDTLLTGPAGVSMQDSPDPAGAGTQDSPGTASAGAPDSPGPVSAGTPDSAGPADNSTQNSPDPAGVGPPDPAAPGAQDSPGPAGADTQRAPRAEPSPATAVRVSSGQLKGLAGHRGSGAASIVRTPNGSHVVQLEDYDVSSGITLYLYVVSGANQQRPGTDSVNLGKLAENTGDRVVPIPSGTDLSGPQTVLIWCEPYRTPIAAANQVPA